MRYTDNLYEFKLPEQRKEGVVRIYFCCDPVVRNSIWLLNAELKVGTKKKEHKAAVDLAERRCREIFLGGGAR